MKIFNFFARNISYTFTIALITIVFGWLIGVFCILLGSSFIIYSYDRLFFFMVKWVVPAVFIASFFHFIFLGFLTPLKIPVAMKVHRMINAAFKKGFGEDAEGQYSNDDIITLYEHFSDFPLHNMVVSFFCLFVISLIVGGYEAYDFLKEVITFGELQSVDKILILSFMVVIIMYGISSYLLTEALTTRERTYYYNLLLKRGISIKPRTLISLQVKFSFFILLLFITLLTFAALLEKGTFYDLGLPSMIFYFCVSITAGVVFLRIITRPIIKILEDLGRVTREIASGGRAGFNYLSLEKEIVSIEHALMDMAHEIEEYRRNLESKVEQRTDELQNALVDLKMRDDQIQKQLDMASVIQRSILPGNIDDWNELKFSVRYIAMEKIGGDFYDVHQLKGDKLGVMIADVSGHGIPAALVTTMAKISFGNAGLKYDSPKRIFQEVNQSILDHVKTQDYLTCFMVSIDDEYNVIYSNASHQKAILLRTESGQVGLLDTNGLFIGAIEDARDSYEEKSIKLNYGDRIVLYTDGIPEAINIDRKEYSNKRLESVVFQNRGLPIEEFCDAIIEDLENHIGNASVEDDITLLVIELARDEAVTLIKDAKKFISAHKFYDAIDVLEKGLKKYPGNQKILYNLSKNYFRINNFSKAVQNIEKYIASDKRNKYAFYIGGASYYQMMDYNNAIDNFERALSLDSNFSNALFALGMTYKKMGSRDDAVKTFEKVVNIDPDNKMALYELNEIRAKK